MTFSKEVKEELNSKIEILSVKKKCDEVIKAMRYGSDINIPLSMSEDCKRAMIKAAFIIIGNISNPHKSYHIEFVCKTIAHSRFVLLMLKHFHINGKFAKRKNRFIVYVKSSDDIILLLGIMGANKALFKMHDEIIYHNLKNRVNRVVNCEIANIKKSVDAATRQINDIHILQRYNLINKLKPGLYEVAMLRLEYPESSLIELGELLKLPVGKSGINHRFREIHEIAKNCQN